MVETDASLPALQSPGPPVSTVCVKIRGDRTTTSQAPDPLFPTPMSVESFPKFTPPAAKLWTDIPAQTRKQLLSNVWCGRCKHSVTIKNFSGVVRSNDLLLVGQCSECQSDVARMIESS